MDGDGEQQHREINLKSNDGRIVTIPISAIMISRTLKELVELISLDMDDTPIPLDEVDYETLSKLKQWMVCYANFSAAEDDLIRQSGKTSYPRTRVWEFVMFSGEKKSSLFRMMNAADYLGIEPFIASSSIFIAEQLKNLMIGDVRQYLNLKDDLSLEEKERLKEEAKWVDLYLS